jgi:hypothetical protein
LQYLDLIRINNPGISVAVRNNKESGKGNKSKIQYWLNKGRSVVADHKRKEETYAGIIKTVGSDGEQFGGYRQELVERCYSKRENPFLSSSE